MSNVQIPIAKRRLASSSIWSMVVAGKALLAICCLGANAADDAPTAEAEAMTESRTNGRYFIDGMLREKDKLVRGSYRCSAIRYTRGEGTDEIPKGHRVSCVFDFDAALIRFDRSQDFPILTDDVVTAEELTSRRPAAQRDGALDRTLDIRYFRTPAKSAHWSWLKGGRYGPHGIDVRPPDYPVPQLLDIWDVRGMGLFTWVVLLDDAPYESVVERLRAGEISMVERVNERCYKVSVLHANRKVMTTIRINEENGFTPEVVEASYLDKNGSWLPPDYVTRTDWRSLGGTWVPAACSAVSLSRQSLGNEYGDKVRQLDLVFEWTSVNEPVDPQSFTAEGLGVPRGTLVLDMRSSPPIMEEVIGEGKLLDERQRAASWDAAIPAWAIYALLAIFAVSVAVLLLQGRWVRRGPGSKDRITSNE